MRWQLGSRDVGGGFGETVAEFFEDGATVPFAVHTLQSLADWLVSTQRALSERTEQLAEAQRQAAVFEAALNGLTKPEEMP